MTATLATPSAAAALLLSSWWSRPVASELASWDRGWPSAGAIADDLGAGHEELRALEAAAQTAQRLQLEDEYERLFVGPGQTPCPPYESLWRADQPRPDQGRLAGVVGAAVADLYREAGLAVAAAAHELPEHVAVEWEAAAWALGRDDELSREIASSLLQEHLRLWLPSFCAAVRRESTQPFYSLLPELTLAWTDRLVGVTG